MASKKNVLWPKKNARMQERIEAWIKDSVDKGKMPSGEIIVSHKGVIVCKYENTTKLKKKDKNAPWIYRLYSMTKPIVSVLALQFCERGIISLHQPIHTVLGEKWKKENMQVMDVDKSQQMGKIVTKPCLVDITIHHLLTHTAGFSHGLSDPTNANPIDVSYFFNGISGAETILLGPGQPGLPSLDDFLVRLQPMPLLFQPGQGWEYSYGLEVMGRMLELLTKKDLHTLLRENVCFPLGMTDTGFYLNKEQMDRTCQLHYSKDGGYIHPEPTHFPSYCSGSAGLFSTVMDYFLFCSMLSRKGEGLNGKRILSPASVKMMMENQLRNKENQPCTYRELGGLSASGAISQSLGTGFGYGGGILVDNSHGKTIASKGEFSWGGAGQTVFWIDNEEEVVVSFMTSVLQNEDFSVNGTLHSLVYGALDETKSHPGIYT